MTRFLLRSALALSFGFGLGACGDDDDTEPPSNTDGGNSDAATDDGNGDDDDRDAASADAAIGTKDAGGSTSDASTTPGDAAASDSGSSNAPGAVQIGADIEGEHDHDQFGTSVALSADGTRVIAGALLNNDAASQAGHARVFERKGDGWVQLGADLDGDAEKDRFGTAVAISDDGKRIAVSSSLNDGNGSASGLVRVFDWADGAWKQVGDDIHGAKNSGAGSSLAMSANGARIVVGGNTPNAPAGVVIVYEEDGGQWTAVGDPLTGDNEFAHAVAISDDGNRIALSSPSAAGALLPGTVRVYDWKSSAWKQVGGDLVGEEEGSYFGGALSLSGDGSVLVVGAENNTGLGAAGGGKKGGSVRVLELVSGKWQQVGKDLDGEPGTGLGTSVGISADGKRLIAGAPSPGFVGVYVLEDDAWSARDIDFGDNARVGQSVAISADGKVGAAGATYFAGKQGSASGRVSVFALGE